MKSKDIWFWLLAFIQGFFIWYFLMEFRGANVDNFFMFASIIFPLVLIGIEYILYSKK